MNPLIDLATQVRTGAAFALKPQGGGTGRIDARSPGIVVSCKSRDLGYTLVAGDVVELEHAYNFGTEPGVIRTSTAGGRVFGVVLEGGDYNASIKVLSGGAIRYVKLGSDALNGQYLHGSAAGDAIATTEITSGIFGVALADGSAGDLIPAYLECDIVFVGRHGQLADSAGIRGHTDLVRGAFVVLDTDWQGNLETIRDGDPATSITESTTGVLTVDLDLGMGRETACTGLAMRSDYSGGATTTVTLKGDSDPTFATATTIFTTAAWATGGGGTDHEELFAPSAAFQYYRIEITVSAGQFELMELHLWEALGAAVFVTDPVSGLGALLDDVLTGFSAGGSGPTWVNVMALDPVSGNYLPVVTGDGDAVYVEV